MTVFSITLNQMIALFIIVIAGYILKRCGLMKDEWVNGLLRLLAMFFVPVLMFDCLQMESSPELARNAVLFSVAFSVLSVVAFVIGFVSFKMFRIRDGAVQASWTNCSWIPNIAFVGIPIFQAVFSPEAVFYASLGSAFSLVLTFTMGIASIRYCSKIDGNRVSPKILLNPCTVALVLGLITFGFKINLPQPVLSATHMVSSVTAPLAMLAVGVLISRVPFKSIFTNWQLYVVLVIRLLITPVIAFFAIRPFAPDYVFLATFVLCAGMPLPPPLLAILSANGGDVLWATRFTVLSTIFSVATLPLLTYLFL